MRTATIPQADPTLTTQMRSAGEAMAIGRTFKESLEKRQRSVETRWPCASTRSGLGGDGKPWRIGQYEQVEPRHSFRGKLRNIRIESREAQAILNSP